MCNRGSDQIFRFILTKFRSQVNWRKINLSQVSSWEKLVKPFINGVNLKYLKTSSYILRGAV